jgi:hypothetical protein
MPQLGFEPTTPVLEQKKTVHGLDRTATVIGVNHLAIMAFYQQFYN